MCTYYYLHRHHTPPCRRPIDYVLHYGFCHMATRDGAAAGAGGLLPCAALVFDPGQSVDCGNPCALGGCTPSPDCSSGACRLADLNGVWICCQCRRGGNLFRWCGHRMRSSPDTLCYHVCCQSCEPDAAGAAQAGGGLGLSRVVGEPGGSPSVGYWGN